MARDLDNVDVCRELDRLVGGRARMTLEWNRGFDPRTGFDRVEVVEGEARWLEARPNCAPVFLRVGESGMPVAGHGFAGGERVPNGVRWWHMLGRVTVVALDGSE